MGFFDIENFSQEADDMSCTPHPLNESMTVAKKTAYLAGIAFSAFVIGAEKNPKTERIIHKVAYAFRLNAGDVKEIYNDILSLKTNSDKKEFFNDAIGNLKDRAVALFFCGDVMRTIHSTEKKSSDASTFMESLIKMFMLDEADTALLSKIEPYLNPDLEKKALALIIESEKNEIKLHSEVLNYFFPAAIGMRKSAESAKKFLDETITLIRNEIGACYYDKEEKELSVEDVSTLKDFHNALSDLESNSWHNKDFVSNNRQAENLAKWFVGFCCRKFSDVDFEFVAELLFEQECQAVSALECPKAPEVYLSSCDYGDFDMYYIKRCSESAATSDASQKFARRFTDKRSERIFLRWCERAHFVFLGETADIDDSDTSLGMHLFNLLLLRAIKCACIGAKPHSDKNLLKSQPTLSLAKPSEDDCLKELRDWLKGIYSYCYWIEYHEYDALHETTVNMYPALNRIMDDMAHAYEWVCKSFLNEQAAKNFVLAKEFVLSTAKEMNSAAPEKNK